MWPQLGVPNVIQSSVEPIGTHDQSTGLEPYQLTQPGWAAAPAAGTQPGTMNKGRIMRPFTICIVELSLVAPIIESVLDEQGMGSH